MFRHFTRVEALPVTMWVTVTQNKPEVQEGRATMPFDKDERLPADDLTITRKRQPPLKLAEVSEHEGNQIRP